MPNSPRQPPPSRKSLNRRVLERARRMLRPGRRPLLHAPSPTGPGAGLAGARAADALRGVVPVPDPTRRLSLGFKRSPIVRYLLLIGLVAVISALYPYGRERNPSSVEVGQVWVEADVAAPFNFPVLKHPAEFEAEQDQARRAVAWVVRADTTPRPIRQALLSGYFDRIDSLLVVHRRYTELALASSPDTTATVDTTGLARLTFEIQPTLALPELLRLTEGGTSPTATPIRALQRRLEPLLLDLAERGVLDRSKAELGGPRDVVSLRLSPTAERVVPTASLVDREEAMGLIAARLVRDRDIDSALTVVGLALAGHLLQPTLYYDPAATAESRETAALRVSDKRGLVKEGQTIVRNGDVISPAIQQQLRSLDRATAQEAGLTGLVRLVTGRFLLTILILSTFFIYLYTFRPTLFNDNAILLLMGLLFVGIGLATAVTVRYYQVSPYIIPVALVSITLTILFDSRVGFYGTVAAALLVAALRGNDFAIFVASAFAGILAVFTVRDIKQRKQLFVSIAVVFGGYALAIVSLNLIRAGTWTQLGTDLLFALGNAALTFLFYPLLYLFERVFGLSTDLTLVELTSLRHPLLQALQGRAPGSFQHSLQVANLSEAAVEAVGGNSLLARVGATFHDVGKMVKPEYFVENQMGAVNKHDRLTPSMSCLVIVSHVKNGEVLAEQHHLPQRVVEFISTHHGTSLMSYFYAKAQQQSGGQTLSDADFRYPGPRPRTREQGIVMLADGVEAAAKSLSEPTPERIEGMIDAIIEARLEEGQLDDCDLTLKDLSRIKSSFLNVLIGVYHSRIKYPGQDLIEGETKRLGPDTGDGLLEIDPNEVVPYPPDRKRRSTFAQAAARGSHQAERDRRKPWQILDDEPVDEEVDGGGPADTHLPSHAAELRLEQAGLVRAFDPEGVADLAAGRPRTGKAQPARKPSGLRAGVGFIAGRRRKGKR